MMKKLPSRYISFLALRSGALEFIMSARRSVRSSHEPQPTTGRHGDAVAPSSEMCRIGGYYAGRQRVSERLERHSGAHIERLVGGHFFQIERGHEMLCGGGTARRGAIDFGHDVFDVCKEESQEGIEVILVDRRYQACDAGVVGADGGVTE